jgi:hypothetical protein
MGAKHTPRPWTVFSDSRYSSCLAEVGHLIVSGPHQVHVWLSDDVTAANARLIASAPELLEALTVLYADYKALADSGDAGNWQLEDTDSGKQALAAIARATGEAS